jgi:integrase
VGSVEDASAAIGTPLTRSRYSIKWTESGFQTFCKGSPSEKPREMPPAPRGFSFSPLPSNYAGRIIIHRTSEENPGHRRADRGYGTGSRLTNIRDRALLLFGFASAMRRSELAALDFEDIEETPDGLRVSIRRSKTDQEGHGDVIAVPRGTIACPVAALKAWLDAAAIATGPVFRPITKGGRIQPARLTDRSVAAIVKAHASRAGLDPKLFAGHSLRSGFLTSAAARGASIFKMADQSRHKSMETLRGYVRDAEIFKHHAGEGLL